MHAFYSLFLSILDNFTKFMYVNIFFEIPDYARSSHKNINASGVDVSYKYQHLPNPAN